MRFFLHTTNRIRIVNGDQEWTGTPETFQYLEPEYPGLPVLSQAPAVTRYQTPEWKYIEDSLGIKHADLFDALPYCEKIATYAPVMPSIYADVILSKNLLCASDPLDSIPFTLAIRTGPAHDDPLIQLSAVWPIMLRQKNGLAMDNILITVENGAFAGAYTHNSALPLGEWYIDEQDFAQVLIGETPFSVKLSNPVRFTVYRNL